MNGESGPHRKSNYRLSSKFVLIGFLAIAAYILWTEHRAHVVQFFPYALVLLCPLLHLFHGGHGNHGGDHAGNEKGGSK